MDSNAALFGTLIIIAAIFLIGREFTTWYFKLNRIVRLLERIATDLETKP